MKLKKRRILIRIGGTRSFPQAVYQKNIVHIGGTIISRYRKYKGKYRKRTDEETILLYRQVYKKKQLERFLLLKFCLILRNVPYFTDFI